MKTTEDTIEQLRVQFGDLVQEVSASRRLLEDLLQSHTGESKKTYLTKMLVKSNGRLIILHIQEIDWIEAWGDYVRIHCKGKSYIVHQKIGDVETQLDPQQFLRIGRSAIINADRIKEMEPLNHGDYLITLLDNTQLNLSRHYRHCLSVMFDRTI